MNRLSTLTAVVLLLAPVIAAADLQARLEACIAMSDKAAQLACFDSLASGADHEEPAEPAAESRKAPAAPAAASVDGRSLQARLESCIALPNKGDQLACFDRVEAASSGRPEVASGPAGADLQARLNACIALPDKADQLACFDGVGGDAVGSNAVAGNQANLQTRLGDCISLPDKAAQMACFDRIKGSDSKGVGDSVARMNPETGEFEYRAMLARVSDGRSFFMQDGQVWRALNPVAAPFRQGEVVVIRPSGGSFVMSQAGTDVTAGVTRIR